MKPRDLTNFTLLYTIQKHLNNILTSFGYSQLIKDATRTTKTTSTIMDHIVTNRPDIVSSSGVRPGCISDHDSPFLSELPGQQS